MPQVKDDLQIKKVGFSSLNLFYIISFLEGSAVMACELSGAKLMAPYYGSSLYVWSSVLGTTLGGLAAGYYLGGMLSQKENIRRILLVILLISSVFMALTPALSALIMGSTISLSVMAGSLFSSLVFIFPALLCFGMVSPLIIRIVSADVAEVGKRSGMVYAISTTGGIIMTFAMGYYFIPVLGLKSSCYITAIVLFIASLLSFAGLIHQKTSTHGKESVA